MLIVFKVNFKKLILMLVNKWSGIFVFFLVLVFSRLLSFPPSYLPQIYRWWKWDYLLSLLHRLYELLMNLSKLFWGIMLSNVEKSTLKIYLTSCGRALRWWEMQLTLHTKSKDKLWSSISGYLNVQNFWN